MSFWSWFSAIENSFAGAWPSVGTCASAARAAASVGVAASIDAPSSAGRGGNGTDRSFSKPPLVSGRRGACNPAPNKRGGPHQIETVSSREREHVEVKADAGRDVAE